MKKLLLSTVKIMICSLYGMSILPISVNAQEIPVYEKKLHHFESDEDPGLPLAENSEDFAFEEKSFFFDNPGTTAQLKIISDAEYDTAALVYSSSDEEVATVSEKGVITAISTGTAEISASVGEYSAVAEVEVDSWLDDYTVNESNLGNYRLALTKFKFSEAEEGTDLNVYGKTLYKGINCTVNADNMVWSKIGSSSAITDEGKDTKIHSIVFHGGITYSGYYAFRYLTAMEYIDISGAVLSNNSQMNNMFEGCSSLETIVGLEKQTVNVTTAFRMFADCKSLKNVDVSKLNTGSVTTMAGMFANCESLETIDTSKWIAKNAAIMTEMFSGCTSLKELNLSSLNSKITRAKGMFQDCRSLEKLDLRNMDYSNWSETSSGFYLFNGCNSLKEMYAPLNTFKFGTGASLPHTMGYRDESGKLVSLSKLANEQFPSNQLLKRVQTLKFRYLNAKTGQRVTGDRTAGDYLIGEFYTLTPPDLDNFLPHKEYREFAGTVGDPEDGILEVYGDQLSSDIQLTPKEITLKLKEQWKVSVSLSGDCAGKSMHWSSEDDTVAAADENGVITGIGEGETIIYCIDPDDETVFNIVYVTVKRPDFFIFADPEKITLNYVGDTAQVKPEFLPASFSTDVSYSSNNTEVAIVDENGLITGVSTGTAVITLTAMGQTAECTVTVPAVSHYPESVAVEPSEYTFTYEQSAPVTMRAVLKTPEGMDDIYDRSVTWSAADQEIAKVDENGTVTPLATGITTVKAETANGLSASAVITVRISEFMDPEFVWNEDYTECKAVFTSLLDGSKKEMPCEIKTEITEPTCEKEGSVKYTATVICDGNQYTDVRQEKLMPLGHEWGEWSETKAPACEEEGQEQRVCKHDSSHVEIRSVPAIGHEWEDWTQTKAPACEEEGQEQRVCRHDSSHVEKRTVPALGHDWQFTKCMWDDGYEGAAIIIECTRCHESKALVATVTKDTEEPSCESEGKTVYTAITEYDGQTFTETKEIKVPALGHAYELSQWKWAEDYSKAEAVFVCTNDSTHITTVEAVITITEAGREKTFTARVTLDGKEYTDTRTETIQPAEGVYRISGSGRFQTAMKIADAYKEEKGIEQFENIILASGGNFADALAGSYLSYVKKAPILITLENFGDTHPYEEVNAYINANLKKGGTVYVLGGTGAVSDTVLTGLEGYEIRRLKGRGRFETNIEILKEAGVKDEEILVATGFNFADSLSASAVNRPILLVDQELSAEQKAYLDTLETEQFYILGGTGAVKETVENQLKEIGTVERIKGKGRHETSVAIAETFCNNADRAVLAYSMNFPDGLCAGPVASVMNSPLILTTKAEADYAAAKAFCSDRGITSGYVCGGIGLIDDEAARNIFSLNEDAEIIKK